MVTDVDVTVGALDADNFFEDTTRPNDITYYEVGKGTKEGGYALQNKGFKFCIPRVGVSPGEKLEFSALLAQLKRVISPTFELLESALRETFEDATALAVLRRLQTDWASVPVEE